MYVYHLGVVPEGTMKGSRTRISNAVALKFVLVKALYCYSDKNPETILGFIFGH